MTRSIVSVLSLVLALWVLLPTAAAADPPPNDSFLTPTHVDSLPYAETVDLAGATAEAVDDGICASKRTVWYSVTLAAGQTIFIDTAGSSFSTHIVVYREPLVPSGTSCGFDGLRSLTAPEAGTFKIRIGTTDPDPQGPLHVAMYTPGSLSGRVVNESGGPIEAVFVSLQRQGDDYETDWYETRSDGTYSFSNLRRGTYTLRFYQWAGEYLPVWYPDGVDPEGAQPVEVADGIKELDDVVMLSAGYITGSVSLPDGSNPRACISLFTADGSWAGWAGPEVEDSFVIGGLRTGSYKLQVNESCVGIPYGVFDEEWYGDATSLETAASIEVTRGLETSGIDVMLDPTPPPTNDEVADAVVIEALPASIQVGLTKATSSVTDPTDCGIVSRSVWYSYVAPEDERVFVGHYGNGAALAIHKLQGDDTLSFVGCSTYSWQSAEVLLEEGQTYMIQVGSTRLEGPAGIGAYLFDSEGGGTLHFNPPTPCLFACPYWNQQRTTAQKNEDACAPTPASNEGSWQDHRIDVPASINGRVPFSLGFAMDPEVDHDVWLCRVEPDEDGKYLVTYSANTPTQPCDNGLPVAGCAERFQASVQPGTSYIIRVYNWADTKPVDGTYWFLATKPISASQSG